MADFSAAFAYILKNEGGFVDNPHDKGGPTNMGITLKTLESWREKLVTPTDIKNLTIGEAEQIYYTRYWFPLRLYALKSQQIATAIFDCGVLFGVPTAALYAQKALSEAGVPIMLDGFLGPKSTAALDAIEPKLFLFMYNKSLLTRIHLIAMKTPSDLEFTAGWENRVNRYLTLT